MSPEEIRIRSLIANITGESTVLEQIPVGMEFHGLYPERVGVDKLHTQEFRDKIKAWPDVFDIVQRHGLMMQREYMLCPYGIKNDNGLRYVAEMMTELEDGKSIMGLLEQPEEAIMDLTKVVAVAKIKLNSNGVAITNLKFVGNNDSKMAEELMWSKMVTIRPNCIGTINKKLGIIQNCKVISFHFKPNAANS